MPLPSRSLRRMAFRGPLAVGLGAAAAMGAACARDVPATTHTGNGPDLVLPPAIAGAPTAPGPFPRVRGFDPVAVNARCEGCHAEIAEEWRGSFHRRAYSDPMVQSQLSREPFAFCKGCHAPEASPAGGDPEERRIMGVGCVTCHVVGDQILAVPKAKGADNDGEHHALTRTPAFEGQAACGGCHEFPFPEEAHRREPLLMQSTMKEHALSSYSDRSCASCHMPVVPGKSGAHRHHGFAASRDEAQVKSAIVVEEPSFDGQVFLLRLRPGVVGHAFPTGDMLRRLALVIEVEDAGGEVVAGQERFLARHFAMTREPNKVPRKVLSRDDRVGAGPGPVEVRYVVRAAPAGGRLRYTLRYERVSDPHGAPDGGALVEGAILLAEGALPLKAATTATGAATAPSATTAP